MEVKYNRLFIVLIFVLLIIQFNPVSAGGCTCSNGGCTCLDCTSYDCSCSPGGGCSTIDYGYSSSDECTSTRTDGTSSFTYNGHSYYCTTYNQSQSGDYYWKTCKGCKDKSESKFIKFLN